MHQNHRNEDGTYSYYMYDGNGQEMEIVVEVGPTADVLEESYKNEYNQEAYARQHRDERVERMRHRSTNMNDDYDGDPIELIPDTKPSVHEQAFPEDKPERFEIIAVRHVIETLSKSRRELYDQRYVQTISQADIARTNGKTRQSVNKRDAKLQDEVRRKLAEAGIDDAYFERHKR